MTKDSLLSEEQLAILKRADTLAENIVKMLRFDKGIDPEPIQRWIKNTAVMWYNGQIDRLQLPPGMTKFLRTHRLIGWKPCKGRGGRPGQVPLWKRDMYNGQRYS